MAEGKQLPEYTKEDVAKHTKVLVARFSASTVRCAGSNVGADVVP